uniref:Transmembrane domain containing protein n=1 Tax=Marseillevirus sp. TaxID=2809551 RepID=A0AA96IXH5_9VIRU|nr:transmembrane domain containing protein [Marseillevirus sp.]
MQASTWVGIGILVFLLLVFGISVYLFVYAEREYSKVSSWPLYSGFAQIGGKDVTLSCPVGKTMTLQRATYSPYGNGAGCSSCEELDVTSDLKTQVDGKNSLELKNIPTTGVWNGTKVCPSGESCASGYVLSGSYSCS